MKKLLIVLIASCRLMAGYSQTPQNWTSAEMYQALLKLKVLGSVLYVAAHPDDENTRLITYLSKDKLYRTGYLSMTRGDGGQNLVGEEQGIELGLLRTQELLAARRTDGGEQFFTRAFDFGYSKNPEETFSKWNKEKILADVVWVIRKFQPDIIVTRFPTTGEGGHGHHTGSAILANEAFAAAADPSRFPEQLKYVSVWQAKRLLWNTFNFGGTNTTREDQFKLDVGGYNPLLGKSYGEIAAESRSQHKSQGFGVPASRGESWEYFRATKGDQPVNDLLDGIDQSWNRVKGGAAVAAMLDSISARFDFLHPEKSVKGLVQLSQLINTLPDQYWKTQKLKEVEQLIAQCSGLFLEATSTEQFAVQTDSLKVSFSFNNRLGADAVLEKVKLDEYDSVFNKPMEKNRNIGLVKTIYVPAGKPITQPYWLVNKMEEGYFNVYDQQKIGQPDADPSYLAAIQIRLYGQSFTFTRPVKYKFTDPVKGELYWPLVILPPAEFEFDNANNISLNDTTAKTFLHFSTNLRRDSADYKVGLNYTDQWYAGRKEFVYKPWPDNQANAATFNLQPRVKNRTFTDTISITVSKDKNQIYAGERKLIQYDHVPSIVYFKDAKANLVQIDLKTYGKKIGYITGAGDKVPESLELMGYEVTLLGDKELAKNNLSQFDAIITGVRAYNTHAWMNKHFDRLMKYVNEGGNLIVQYNTSNQIGPVRAKIGPYPFTITRNRVTDENAAVSLLMPEHPVFNFPNKIGPDDFKGWKQERSIYHASDTSGKFEKLIGMADPGEKSDDGSLLVAKYGKGWFTYTGIVFFRELPAGIPGAYRLLANIIALNKKKGF
jgi:LmbE family N-acetylglucosaminyl deacetylase